MNIRQAGRIVSVAMIVAIGVIADSRREALGLDFELSETETFWTGFMRKLAQAVALRGAAGPRSG